MYPYLSPEMHVSVVQWFYRDKLPVHHIATLARCSQDSVYQAIWNQTNFGTSFHPNGHSQHHPRELITGDIQYILSILQASPTLYLDEIQTWLFTTCYVSVSLSTISRTLYRIGYTHKATANEAAEHNQ